MNTSQNDNGREIVFPSWTIKLLPIIAVLLAAPAAWYTLKATVEHDSAQITKLESRVLELEKEYRKDLASMRDSLGVVQLNIARICQKVRADCHD